MPIKYIEIECSHLRISDHFSSEYKDKGFVLSLDEIACIRPYYQENGFIWRIQLKCWNENHTLLVSKECGDKIIKTLYTNGELLKIEEKGKNDETNH